MQRLTHILKETGILLKDTFVRWNRRGPFRSSTVIAYYTIFSLPGLCVIIINLAGYLYGREALSNQISAQIAGMIGIKTAEYIERIVANAYTSEGITLSSVISFITLLFGATGVFYQVQIVLNGIWGAKSTPRKKYLKFLKDRLFSFTMVLIIGFLLLVSLVISSIISALSEWINQPFFEVTLHLIDITISLSVLTFLFAAIYKILPDAYIRWKEVWGGAFITSILFVIAKFALGLYFGLSHPASIYGTAGSIILIMLWTTYSGMILLYGAEFTKVYADRYRKI